jgi:type IX secretion system PorP/SprF family membrane protein
MKPILALPYKSVKTIINMRSFSLIAALLVLTASFLPEKAQAQDPQFSQFYAAPLYLNPAFAGSARCPRIGINYRNQWPALNKTYITSSVSYDQHVDNLSGGLGLIIMNDKAGDGTINTTSISGMYSYQLNISRDFSIRMGMQATLMQKKLDWDKLYFGDQIDPRYGFVYNTQENRPSDLSKSYPDFSAGILAYSSKVYGGVAVNHLTQPDEAFIVEGSSALPMKITAHFGAMLPVGDTRVYRYAATRAEGTYVSPNVLYQQQGSANQLNLGVYVLKSPMIGGLWMRSNFGGAGTASWSGESFIALVGVQKGLFKFGYSYDVTISKLTNNATAGSHEISLGIQFECRPKKKRFRTISCPSF